MKYHLSLENHTKYDINFKDEALIFEIEEFKCKVTLKKSKVSIAYEITDLPLSCLHNLFAYLCGIKRSNTVFQFLSITKVGIKRIKTRTFLVIAEKFLKAKFRIKKDQNRMFPLSDKEILEKDQKELRISTYSCSEHRSAQ